MAAASLGAALSLGARRAVASWARRSWRRLQRLRAWRAALRARRAAGPARRRRCPRWRRRAAARVRQDRAPWRRRRVAARASSSALLAASPAFAASSAPTRPASASSASALARPLGAFLERAQPLIERRDGGSTAFQRCVRARRHWRASDRARRRADRASQAASERDRSRRSARRARRRSPPTASSACEEKSPIRGHGRAWRRPAPRARGVGSAVSSRISVASPSITPGSGLAGSRRGDRRRLADFRLGLEGRLSSAIGARSLGARSMALAVSLQPIL